MTDEEIICTFMEPKPLDEEVQKDDYCGASPKKWWHWHDDYESGKNIIYHRELDLDALHEVEAQLTEEQWKEYNSTIVAEVWQGLGRNNPYLAPWKEFIRKLVYATAEQKIKALAQVLRKEAEK